MRKILGIILILTIVFSMGSFNSVLAQTEPTVTIETVEAKAGDTVAVKVLIANNPGIWGMDLKVSYDRTALTLESVENGDFFGSGEWTKGNVENETYTLSYAANDFADITIQEGILATLTFKVSDTAEAGEYNITASYNAGDIININFDEIDFNIVNGNVAIKEEIPQITGTIIGAAVDIGSTLTINCFAEAPENATMKFTSSSGKVTVVNGVLDEKTGYYKFAYEGINPQCMSDNIKAELMVGETVLDTKENYSVKTYCENQIARSEGELNLTPNQIKVLKTLLADMLVYGSASQEYRDYNVENLADTAQWVSEYKSTFTVPTGVRKVTGNADSNNKALSVGLNMANVNRIYFKLILTDDVTITLNGVEVDKSALVKNADGSYTLYSEDIKATQFNNVFTLILIKNGDEITKVEYNVNAYIQAKYNTVGLENIVKALSNYGVSAINYQKALVEGDFNLEDDMILF